MSAVAALKGHDLGRRVVSYDESDAILYALCVGAGPDELPLVYERGLHVLPTFALGLGLWAVEDAGALGAYDRLKSLHAAQHMTVHEPLPRAGKLEMHARVAQVWDKGSAATIDIVVECEQVTATYSIHLPGSGGKTHIIMNTFTFTVPRTSRIHLVPGVSTRITKTLPAMTDHMVTPLLLLDHESAGGTVSPVSVLD